MTACGVGVLLVVLPILLAVVSLSTCQQAVFPKPQGNPGQPVGPPAEDADSDQPTASIMDASAMESAGHVSLAVTLSSTSATTVTAGYVTDSGTAREGEDFVATNGTLTFSPGSVGQTIKIPIRQDDTDEADRESFTVRLDGVENATLGDAVATATILDDDLTVGVAVAASSVVEGGVARFAVTVTGGRSSSPVEVGYQVTGTAQPGADYAAPPGMLTLATGTGAGTIAIHTVADEVLDPGETMQVRLESATTMPGAVTVNPAQAQASVTIADPGMVTISVVAVRQAVAEGEEAEFGVTLTSPVASTVTLRWTTADGTATAGADYAAVSEGLVTFSPGSTAQTILVPTLQDNLDEADESFSVTLLPANLAEAVTLGTATATVVIADDDDPPLLRIADVTVVEGTTAQFAVTLGAPSSRRASVEYATSDGTAEQPADYEAASNVLTFAAGETVKTIGVLTNDDVLDEPDGETFVVTLSDLVHVTLSGGAYTLQATGTIMDNDEPPVLRIMDATASEGEAAEFVVTLDAASALPVTVAYATSSGSAEQPADYAAASGVLTLAAGERKQTIAVLTRDDELDESDRETFMVTLSSAENATLVGGGSTLQATGTIMDNDEPPVLRIAGATASEGEAAEFAVTLDAASALPVTVAYATGDGTARAGEDYTPVPGGTLTFVAGDTERTIRIGTRQDTRNEDRETFTVTLSRPSNATLGADAATAVGTIVDDDALPVLSLAGATVSEGETAEFVATLSPASGRLVTAAYRTADGTARAGEDFTAASRMTLTFVAGATDRTIRVATTQDTRNESDERFTVTLSNPSNATLTGGVATATGVIVDDDDGDDHGDTRSAATAIQPGTPISGRLETATDVDYFKVAVSASSTLVAATDAAKAADRQHHQYRNTVVRIEGFGYFSSNTDSFDTAEVRVGVPGTHDIFVRVTGAHVTDYDLAVWLIHPEAPDGSFDIALRFLGTTPTAAQQRTIRAAARVWERVITRGLPDRPVASSDESCEAGDPSLFGELIDDLLINIRLQAIDGRGGVLAAAGPCWIRSDDGLPYLGDVLFDTADLAQLELHDALGGTVAHEIAHVLGFGLLWGDSLKEPSLGRSDNRIASQDTHFAGPEAVAKFDAAGGNTYVGAKVPVENDTAVYGSGALDAHWRESVFGAEMMTTSVVIADPPEPLSAVTIASLADLGYEVDYSQAQSYLLPAAVSSRKAGPGALRLIQLHNDIRRKPIRVGDPPESPAPVIVR